MQADDLNGVGLILQIVFSVAIIFFFGKSPEKKTMMFIKIAYWIPLGFLLSVVISLAFTYKCDDSGNSPFYQGLVPAYCFALINIFVPRKVIVLICAIILFISGFTLAANFSYLVNKTGNYTYANSYTGLPVDQACSADPNKVHPNATKRWHTPLTRIYRINH